MALGLWFLPSKGPFGFNGPSDSKKSVSPSSFTTFLCKKLQVDNIPTRKFLPNNVENSDAITEVTKTKLIHLCAIINLSCTPFCLHDLFRLFIYTL